MKNFLVCFVPILIVPVVIGILFRPRKKTKSSVLYYPAYIIVLPAILVAFWGVIYVLAYRTQPSQFFSLEMLPVWIVSFIIYGSAIYLMIKGINWRLEIQDDCIRYRNLFRVTKEYSYADIQCIIVYGPLKEPCHGKIRRRIDKYKICSKNKKIVVEYLVFNFQDSLPQIKKNMKKHRCELKMVYKE